MPRYPLKEPAPGYAVVRVEVKPPHVLKRLVRYYVEYGGTRLRNETTGAVYGFYKRSEAVAWSWQDYGQRKAAEEQQREGTASK